MRMGVARPGARLGTALPAEALVEAALVALLVDLATVVARPLVLVVQDLVSGRDALEALLGLVSLEFASGCHCLASLR